VLVSRSLSHIDDQLHAAAHRGEAHTCRLLLSQGALTTSIRFQPSVGFVCTALDQAIACGSVETVQVMLAARVTPFLGQGGEQGPHNDFLCAAIRYAKRNMAPQLEALLATRNESQLPDMDTPVRCAIEHRAFDSLLVLRDAGAKLDSQQDNNKDDARLALHEAAGNNKAPAVEALLQMGLTSNCTDVNARTPLHVAAAGGFIEVAQLLIEAQADLNACGVQGWTPALRAAQRGQLLSVRQLYAAKADLTQASGHISPAWIAACNGHLQVIRFIWENTDHLTKQTVKIENVLEIAKARNPTIAEYIGKQPEEQT